MSNNRNELAEKMEIVGRIFEIDGMPELLRKFEAKEEGGKKVPLSVVKFNAVIIQVSALLLQADKTLADKVIAMSTKKTDAEVQKMEGDTIVLQDLFRFVQSHINENGKTVWSTPYTVRERKVGNSLRLPDKNGDPGAIPFGRIIIRRKDRKE